MKKLFTIPTFYDNIIQVPGYPKAADASDIRMDILFRWLIRKTAPYLNILLHAPVFGILIRKGSFSF